MRKKILIKTVSILLFLAILFCIQIPSFAEGEDKGNFNFEAFDGDDAHNTDIDNAAGAFMGTGLSVIRVVATGISLIMISYIGIKYMLAAPAERADLKKSVVIYVFGAVLVFAAGNIMDIIIGFAGNISTQ